MDKKRSIMPDEIEQAFREAHILALGADNEHDMNYALRKRAAIEELMIRFCGYTPIELQLILLKINGALMENEALTEKEVHMKTYILIIDDTYGYRRKTTVSARSRAEALKAVPLDHGEQITVCKEI